MEGMSEHLHYHRRQILLALQAVELGHSTFLLLLGIIGSQSLPLYS